MSETAFHNMLLGIKPAPPFVLGIADLNGTVISCTEPSRIGSHMAEACAFLGSLREAGEFASYTFRRFAQQQGAKEYVVFAGQAGESAAMACGIIAAAIENSNLFCPEQSQRAAFVKKTLLEPVLPEWVQTTAHELHLRNDAQRVVFLVHSRLQQGASIEDLLLQLFPGEHEGFVVPVNESDVVLVKELHASDAATPAQLACQIDSAIAEKLGEQHTVGVGTVAADFTELSRSFREAQTAVQVSSIFNKTRSVAHYDALGVGRLLYQLPPDLCKRFLAEVFHGDAANVLDEETLLTVQAFFANSLNVSEAARKLSIHRNTLVYRLEKIKKLTGLDLHGFDDALLFQLALMVRQYLASAENDG